MFAAERLTVGGQSSCPTCHVIYPQWFTLPGPLKSGNICSTHPVVCLQCSVVRRLKSKLFYVPCPLSEVLISAPNDHPIVPSYTYCLQRIQTDWYSGMSGGFRPCYVGYACPIAAAWRACLEKVVCQLLKVSSWIQACIQTVQAMAVSHTQLIRWFLQPEGVNKCFYTWELWWHRMSLTKWLMG